MVYMPHLVSRTMNTVDFTHGIRFHSTTQWTFRRSFRKVWPYLRGPLNLGSEVRGRRNHRWNAQEGFDGSLLAWRWRGHVSRMQFISRSWEWPLNDRHPGSGDLSPITTRIWILPMIRVRLEVESSREPSDEHSARLTPSFWPHNPWAGNPAMLCWTSLFFKLFLTWFTESFPILIHSCNDFSFLFFSVTVIHMAVFIFSLLYICSKVCWIEKCYNIYKV